MTSNPAQLSPVPLFEACVAYQRTAALKAAVELDLFTAIGEGADRVAPLASRCNAAERGIRILCDYLAVAGFLAKTGDRYALTPESAAFLDRRSPAAMGSVVEFLAAPHNIAAFLDDPAAVVRRGGTVLPEGGTIAPESPVWVTFARAMMPMVALPAELLAERATRGTKPGLRVLDVAAGHGLYGIAVARRDAEARVTALDWPNVLKVAEENAAKAGLGERFATRPGSAFDVDPGGPYDLILVTNFLHHFDPPTCIRLLSRFRAALAPGGRAIVLEFVPNPDRVSPPLAAMFPWVMLATTPSGDAYTYEELDRMCREAGFARTSLEELPPVEQRIVIAET